MPGSSRRRYSELRRIETFEERYEYLRIGSLVGEETFGADRHLNQSFYRSREWKQIRHHVIARDNGCDLGIEGHDIYGIVLVHHMNPVIVDDFDEMTEDVINPEFLITTTHATHNAIHYGDAALLPRDHIPRTAGDTKLW